MLTGHMEKKRGWLLNIALPLINKIVLIRGNNKCLLKLSLTKSEFDLPQNLQPETSCWHHPSSPSMSMLSPTFCQSINIQEYTSIFSDHSILGPFIQQTPPIIGPKHISIQLGRVWHSLVDHWSGLASNEASWNKWLYFHRYFFNQLKSSK